MNTLLYWWNYKGWVWWDMINNIPIVITCLLPKYIENNVCTRVTNCFSAHERVILVYIPELRSNEGNKYQNYTWVSTETVRHENTYIILFLTWHTESINDDKNDDLYTSAPCLTGLVFILPMTSQSIANDVTMTRQLWHDHVNSDISGHFPNSE